MKIIGENGEKISDRKAVTDKRKNSFSELLQQRNDFSGHENRTFGPSTRVPEFEEEMSVLEVNKAILKAKREKECGVDGIPSDVFRNDTSVSFLHVLFNVFMLQALLHLTGVRAL